MKEFLKHAWQPILMGATLGTANIMFYNSWQFWVICLLYAFKVGK